MRRWLRCRSTRLTVSYMYCSAQCATAATRASSALPGLNVSCRSAGELKSKKLDKKRKVDKVRGFADAVFEQVGSNTCIVALLHPRPQEILLFLQYATLSVLKRRSVRCSTIIAFK